MDPFAELPDPDEFESAFDTAGTEAIAGDPAGAADAFVDGGAGAIGADGGNNVAVAPVA